MSFALISSYAAIGLGAFAVYKILTVVIGEPGVTHVPKLPNTKWGDDQMVFINEMHKHQRVGQVEVMPVDDPAGHGLAQVNIGGALYEHNLDPMNDYRPEVPETVYYKSWPSNH